MAAQQLKGYTEQLQRSLSAAPRTTEVAAQNRDSSRKPEPPALDYDALAQRLRIPMSAPNSAAFAQEVADCLRLLRTPTPSPGFDLDRLAAEVVRRLRASTPVVGSLAKRSRSRSPTISPPPGIVPLAARSSQELQPQCLACPRPRTKFSKLWCEACRHFLQRVQQAQRKGRALPTCLDLSHSATEAESKVCRGCRSRRLLRLEADALGPDVSKSAGVTTGFVGGGGCDRQPLRIRIGVPTERRSYQEPPARAPPSTTTTVPRVKARKAPPPRGNRTADGPSPLPLASSDSNTPSSDE